MSQRLQFFYFRFRCFPSFSVSLDTGFQELNPPPYGRRLVAAFTHLAWVSATWPNLDVCYHSCQLETIRRHNSSNCQTLLLTCSLNTINLGSFSCQLHDARIWWPGPWTLSFCCLTTEKLSLLWTLVISSPYHVLPQFIPNFAFNNRLLSFNVENQIFR